MFVRAAQTNDIPAIIEIACKARQKIYADFMDADIWKQKRDQDFEGTYTSILLGTSSIEKTFFPVLVDDQNQVVGYGIAGYISEAYRDTCPLHWIHEIFLDPEKTGAGYGKQLMKSMGEYFQSLAENHEFGLSVGQTNEDALRFYKNLGGTVLRAVDDNKVHGYDIPANIIVWKSEKDLLQHCSL